MTTLKIEIDVLEAVKEFYPGLSEDNADLIAREIVHDWDYSEQYNTIVDEIHRTADSYDIELEGKDGVEIETDNIYVFNPPHSPLFP